MKKRHLIWLLIPLLMAAGILVVHGTGSATERPVGAYMDTLYERDVPVLRLHVQSVVPMKEVVIRWSKSYGVYPSITTLQGHLGTNIVRDYSIGSRNERGADSQSGLTITVYTSNQSRYVISWHDPPVP